MARKKKDTIKPLWEAKEWLTATFDEYAYCGMLVYAESSAPDTVGWPVVRQLGLPRTYKVKKSNK